MLRGHDAPAGRSAVPAAAPAVTAPAANVASDHVHNIAFVAPQPYHAACLTDRDVPPPEQALHPPPMAPRRANYPDLHHALKELSP